MSQAMWDVAFYRHHVRCGDIIPRPMEGFPAGSNSKESTCNAGDPGLVPELGRSHEGNDNPLQYSCLENSMDRGVWRAIVCGIEKSRT